jgi:hypothetical protein
MRVVCDVTLLLEDPKQRPHSAVAGRLRQLNEDLGYRCLARPMQDIHDLPLSAAQGAHELN